MNKQEGINYFCDQIIDELNNISNSSKKADMVASMNHWKVLLSNIKDINNTKE
jgi:hypothetical protein